MVVTAIVSVLLSLAVACALACSLGLLVMRDAVDRLHFVGPAVTVAPFLVALAIVVEDGLTSGAGLKATSIAIAAFWTAPMLSYATLRALRTRSGARVSVPDDAVVQT